MPTPTEAVKHFTTIVSGETSRQLEKASVAATATQSEFIKAGAMGGSRMYLTIGKAFADHLVPLREFIQSAALELLKPYAEHADKKRWPSYAMAQLKRLTAPCPNFAQPCNATQGYKVDGADQVKRAVAARGCLNRRRNASERPLRPRLPSPCPAPVGVSDLPAIA